VLFDLGVDFFVDNNLSLGFCFAFLVGSLHQYDYNDGKQTRTIKLDNNNLKGLSRLDLSVGLRWNM